MEEFAATTAATDRAADAIDRPAALGLVEDLLGGLERETAPTLRVALLCRIAEVYERRLADHGGALALLETLYRRRGDWDRLADVLDRKWMDRFRDPNRIADVYGEILRAEPKHLPSLMGLARVHEALGDWQNAIALLTRA